MPVRPKPPAKPPAKPGAKPRAKAPAKPAAKPPAKAAKPSKPVAPKVAPKLAKGKARAAPPKPKVPSKGTRKTAAKRTPKTPPARAAESPSEAIAVPDAGEGIRASPYDERLGELPQRYYDDSFVSLPLGPDALFFYWDFRTETESAAREGLPRPRAVLTLYSGGRAVEHIDFALESRAYYVRSLEPGETYEAEIFFVGENGDRRRVGRASNAVTLPPRGASPIVDDRFVSFPWGAPLGTAEHPYAAGPLGVARTPRLGPQGSSPTGPVGRGLRAIRPAPAR